MTLLKTPSVINLHVTLQLKKYKKYLIQEMSGRVILRPLTRQLHLKQNYFIWFISNEIYKQMLQKNIKPTV